jgi:hypothetical protein
VPVFGIKDLADSGTAREPKIVVVLLKKNIYIVTKLDIG